MRTGKHSQKLTVLTLAVALAVAVYLNWEYARTGEDHYRDDYEYRRLVFSKEKIRLGYCFHHCLGSLFVFVVFF